MAIKKTLGGDRLGAGKRMQIDLNNYGRSTHNLSYTWRSTMAPGTLVPFLSKPALPGDTWDINLDLDMRTLPTNGPLFGSFKVQADIFQCPIRLYNSLLHNNMLGIGLRMQNVKFPIISLRGKQHSSVPSDIDNSQINPSALLSYLGIRGVGMRWASPGTLTPYRDFNAIPILAYHDIYKNYYANRQEEIGCVLHSPNVALVNTVTTIEVFQPPSTTTVIPQTPNTVITTIGQGATIKIKYTVGGSAPLPSQILFITDQHGSISAAELAATTYTNNATTGELTAPFRFTMYGQTTIRAWKYIDGTNTNDEMPKVATFPLTNLDEARKAILSYSSETVPFSINTHLPNIEPYKWLHEAPNNVPNALSSQEGLLLKTYQSDLFNSWLLTESITGPGGINDITAIDTSSGQFTIDTLVLARKVYNMLNRIAVSGGTYHDWIEAVYTIEDYRKAETPMYMGGIIRELVFQEVVSQSSTAEQDLGTLAGKGILARGQKGGNVYIKVTEPSYIMGIISITPRVDYSQGNAWDTELKTMDDLHKPELDQIGFQDLITTQLAWWDSTYNSSNSTWNLFSAGKQPAWVNYMTSVNETRGNFAKPLKEMFMTLNRRYELDTTTNRIKDLTTYIDPSKFNYIFAEQDLSAQNFWAQIGINIECRRLMSAKPMPNL